MVKPRQKAAHIRIYVEGGGRQRHLRAPFREGFDEFFREIKQRTSLTVIPCGSTSEALEDFRLALSQHEDSFVMLLIDSDAEKAPSETPTQFLKRKYPTWSLPAVDDDHYHFMVQVMEAWFVADKQALQEYYARNLHEKALPMNPQVEQISKTDLYSGLKAATKDSSKGEYEKREHSAGILKRLDRRRVCDGDHVPHCTRLFEVLAAYS